MKKYRRKMESFTIRMKKTLKIIFLRNLLKSMKNLKKKYDKSDVADMIGKLSKFEIKKSEKIFKIKKNFKETLALLDAVRRSSVRGFRSLTRKRKPKVLKI